MPRTDVSDISSIRAISYFFVVISSMALPVQNGVAQNTDSLRQEWIDPMVEMMNFRLDATNQKETFSVQAGDFHPVLSPNTSTTLNFTYSYRFAAFSVGYAPSFIPGNNDNEIKGKTKNLAFSFALFRPHWLAIITAAKKEGYYLENTHDFDNSWSPGDPYLLLPDMKTSSVETVMAYSSNKNFSFSSLITQTERQLKSAGTFTPFLAFRFYDMNNLTYNSGQKSKNTELVLGAGYHYTFVFSKHFYTSLGLSASGGYVFTKLTSRGQIATTGDIISTSHAPIVRGEGRVAIGYNGARFFVGVLTELHDTFNRQQNTTVINTDRNVFYQAFAGYRLTAPAPLKRAFDKIVR